MEFLSQRNDNAILFPRPADRATVRISPPGLAWLPADGATGYRVEIRRDSGEVVYEKDVGRDPVHLPDQVLEPGAYTWDVTALDETGAAARRGEKTFTIASDVPALPWIDPAELLSRIPPEHPRLLYARQNLDAIRATLETTRQRSWRSCLRAADRALDMPAPVYPQYHLTEDSTQCRLEYKNYFADFRRYINGALMDLSLAFLMTREEKYAAAAKRILLEVAGWPTDDDDDVTSVSARWGDEPGLSMSRCAHRAYDWLYDALDDDERRQVLKMCDERAWQTLRRLEKHDYLTYPGNSHEGRLIAYLSEMAVAMAGESDGAAAWLEYSLEALTTFYPHWGGHEGGWAEGAPYGLWYNEFYVPAFETLRAATGFDLWQRPFFRQVPYFFFYCAAIRGEIRPFGDSAEKGGPGTPGGSGYAALLWHRAHRYADPHLGWWAEQIHGWSGSRGELSLLYPDQVESAPPVDLPGSRAFRGVGWAALHSDLTSPDDDTFLLFKSSPYGSVSHSHADQNAFAIMKGGRALAIPSGYYGPAYGLPHHAEWTRSTKANNCVLVDDRGQTIRDARASGRITAFEDRPGLTYVAGDATPAYMGKMERWVRHILFLRPGLFLLLDELEAPQPARFQWMLHAFDEMEVDDRLDKVVSRRNGAELEVHLCSSTGLHLTQTDQFDTPYNAGIPDSFHEEVPNHWHLTAETVEKSQTVRIAAAMAVRGTEEHLALELLEHDGWFGARTTSDQGSVDGWVQLQPGTSGPADYASPVSTGSVLLCGTAADGERFTV